MARGMSLLNLVPPEQWKRVCCGIILVCMLIAIIVGVQIYFTYAGARRDSIEQATNGTGGCDESKCRSTDGRGGFDCWAGPLEEAFSCADGLTATKTGKTMQHQGLTFEHYTCCSEHVARVGQQPS